MNILRIIWRKVTEFKQLTIAIIFGVGCVFVYVQMDWCAWNVVLYKRKRDKVVNVNLYDTIGVVVDVERSIAWWEREQI